MIKLLLVGDLFDADWVSQVEAQENWELIVATDGGVVSDHLATQFFNLVVMDISLSAINGIDFLLEIKKHYPDVIRIALFSDPKFESELEHIQAAHQLMLKPVTKEQLVGAIHRRLDMKIILGSAELKKAVDSLHKLPSLPDLYQKIVAQAGLKNSTLEGIAVIVGKDIAMTAKILQLVNSAFFGLENRVSTVAQAINLLGLDAIKGLVLQVHLFDGEFASKMKKNRLEQLTAHSQKVGCLAREIAKLEGMPDKHCDMAMLAGMLHDVGQLAFAVSYPDQYESSPVCSNCLLEERQEWERQTFGAPQSEVGAYLMDHWGLPGELVEAIAYHQNPLCTHVPELSPLTAVHIANVLIVQSGMDEGPAEKYVELCQPYLEKLGIADHEPQWRKVLEATLSE